jgi:four helix bundle protein
MTSRRENFNQQLRERTFNMAVLTYEALKKANVPSIARPIVNQIIRSSSSVASNYRAATRSRSDSEFYSKICIVVEEIDETQFWLEYLTQIDVLVAEDIGKVSAEVGELVKLFTSIRSTMKAKLKNN